MKKFFICTAAIAALLLIAPVAQADTSAQSFGITNAVLTGSATTTALGQSTVSVKNYPDCSVVFKATTEVTNVSAAITVTLARVNADGNIETSPKITWTFNPYTTGADNAVSVTNALVQWTNFPSTVIGSATSLKLISIQVANNASGFVRSPYLYTEVKRTK